MPRFFENNVSQPTHTIGGENARHMLKALRVKVGERIVLSDGNVLDYDCVVTALGDSTLDVKVIDCYKNSSEPSIYLHIYQGVAKGDKMEDIIQKCVEIGASEFTPVLAKRSVSRPNAAAAAKKTERYNKIALAAAKQSGRGIVPRVNSMLNFDDAVKECTADLKILFYEDGGCPLSQLFSGAGAPQSAAVFIGPEGGFEASEVSFATQNGAAIATLGKRILRTQTAPVVAAACIMLLSGNMD